MKTPVSVVNWCSLRKRLKIIGWMIQTLSQSQNIPWSSVKPVFIEVEVIWYMYLCPKLAIHKVSDHTRGRLGRQQYIYKELKASAGEMEIAFSRTLDHVLHVNCMYVEKIAVI